MKDVWRYIKSHVINGTHVFTAEMEVADLVRGGEVTSPFDHVHQIKVGFPLDGKRLDWLIEAGHGLISLI